MRLVRHVAPNGNVRVLMTNMFDTALATSTISAGGWKKRLSA
jgi:hypothetical protein